MKSFHIVALAAVAALAAASGCSDDVQKTTYSGSSGFGFAASVLNVEVGSANANQILVPIYRGSEDAQIAELKFEYDISKALGISGYTLLIAGCAGCLLKYWGY